MAYTKLGRIRPVHKGNWSASTAYTALEMVRSGNVSYIANKDVPAGTPLNNGEYWAVVLDVSAVIADVEASADSANQAAANANAVMDVKANALAASITGNPVQFYPDEGSVIKPVLTFEPIQEGSGDPYPAGGGKNLLENTATTQTVNGVTFTVNEDGTVTANGTATANTYFYINADASAFDVGTEYILSGCPDGGSTSTYRVTFQYYDSSNALKFLGNDVGGGSKIACTETMKNPQWYIVVYSGVTVSNLVFKPMIRLASITDATYAPYANIRPFIGRTGTELVRCGKNLCPGFESGAYSYANGSKFDSEKYQRTKKIPITEGALYAHSTSKGWNPNDIHFWDKNGVWLECTNDISKLNNRPVGAAYVAFNYLEHGITWVQLELGSTNSPFEPYQGNTYALDFGQTVYGGTLDWNKGEMVVDKGFVELNGTEAFTTYDGWANKHTFYCDGLLNGAVNIAGHDTVADISSSHAGISTPNRITFDANSTVAIGQGAGTRLYTCLGKFSTVADFKAYLAAQYAAGTPVQICYKLATPITIQLAPQQITALAGVNTVYGDADGMTVGYNKPIEKALEEALDQISALREEYAFDYAGAGMPMLYLSGDTTGMTKDNPVTLNYKYGTRSGTCTVKWQGSSSLSFPKKNYTIKFDSSFEAADGWGAQSKYCFKANFIDHSHARNICSCRLWGKMAAIRDDVIANANLSALPNAGAIDGFPCIIILNGEFHGLYTWNIPKDGWMFGSPKAIVCAENVTDATYFKALATLNGDFKLEYVEDENDSDWVLPSLNKAIQAVINSNGTNMWNTCNAYISIHSAIDYFIHTVDECAKDCTGKNYLLVTYDKVRWYMSPYDRDTTYGIEIDGKSFLRPDATTTYASFGAAHRLMGLILNYDTARLKARAIRIRDEAKTEAVVAEEFTAFAAGIPSRALADDALRWPTLPSTNASNVAQILNWYRLRRKYLDAEIEAWG